MNFFQTKKGNEGQIVIITLLLLGTFAAIAASVITQVVFEQKKAVLEEKTQKAYYAAESGIENALKQIQTSNDNELTTTDLVIGEGGSKTAQVTLSKNNEGNSATFVVPTVLNSGEPFNVNLVGYTGTDITVCWDKAGTSVQAALLYTVADVAKSSFYAANSVGMTSPKVPLAQDAATNVTNKCGLSTGNYVVFALPTGASTEYVYMTIWPLYQEKTQFGFESSVGATIPKQGVTITSQAQVTELSSKVTRSVRYFQSLTSYLPDYLSSGLYAGGGVIYGPGKNW